MTAGTDSQGLIESTRELVERTLKPNAQAIDRERRFPAENLRAFAERGLMGLMVPTTYGGLGGSLGDLVRVEEEIGRGCASTAMCFLMHCCGVATIAAKATPEQGERWLRPAAQGVLLATLAFSERGTGAHFYQPELALQARNGSFLLSGRKSFVTSGGHADLYPVLVQSPAGQGLDIFVVEKAAAGLSFEGAWNGVGMSGNSSIVTRFEDVRLAEADRLGPPGSGQELVFNVVAPTFLAGLAAVNVGIAQSALDDAVEHAKTRRYATGSSLSEVPAVQRHLADMAVEAESARQLVRAAAAAADRGDAAALAMLIEAKIGATRAAQRVTETAMEVGGGLAYSRAVDMERHWRDARAGSVMAPTNDVLAEWLGKVLTGLPLF
ncbi:MAG TPA: acyl-CoA dehydrogenase family protein [Dehalococcoidia bacterium]|nr:acyl-CoA dehydrogenase family protein [Dehalococcoidia bacterium]